MTESTGATPVAEPIAERMSWRDRLARAMGGDAWTVGLAVAFVALYVFTLVLRPNYALEALAIASLPVAFAAAGQAIVVISGGIDLSIGSVIALTNVISAVLLLNAPELSLPIVLLVLLIGILIGLVNGALVVTSRVPDIVVTLAMLFVWAGAALLVLPTPGGDSVPWLGDLIDDGFLVDAIPRALVVLLGIFILGLIRADLLFLGVQSAYSTVIQGVIMVAVVMLGAYVTLRRKTV
jgi:ribose transport system permease protein